MPRPEADRNFQCRPDATEILHRGSESIGAVIGGAMNRFSRCLAVLTEIADELGVPVAVVGDLAAIHHGARVTTLDVDVVVSQETAGALLVEGPRRGLRVRRESPRGWHQLVFPHPEGDVDIHVIPEGTKGPRDPEDAPPIPGPQDLGVSAGVDYAALAPWVVMKLVSGRDKDRYHLVEVLKGVTERDLSATVERLSPLPPRYLAELERLVREAAAESSKDAW